MLRVTITISLKEGVLDPEGQAIEHSLSNLAIMRLAISALARSLAFPWWKVITIAQNRKSRKCVKPC